MVNGAGGGGGDSPTPLSSQSRAPSGRLAWSPRPHGEGLNPQRQSQCQWWAAAHASAQPGETGTTAPSQAHRLAQWLTKRRETLPHLRSSQRRGNGAHRSNWEAPRRAPACPGPSARPSRPQEALQPLGDSITQAD